jgi:hypothetical protein
MKVNLDIDNLKAYLYSCDPILDYFDIILLLNYYIVMRQLRHQRIISLQNNK